MSCEKYTYHGYGNDNSAGGRLVVIQLDDDIVAVLPHIPKHADAFSWGYGGSSPSDLARCLLIHALGAAARCTMCNATGAVAASVRWAFLGPEISAVATSEPDAMVSCPRCDHGYLVLPDTYLDFKNDVIARLPQRYWRMTRSEVLLWLDDHRER